MQRCDDVFRSKVQSAAKYAIDVLMLKPPKERRITKTSSRLTQSGLAVEDEQLDPFDGRIADFYEALDLMSAELQRRILNESLQRAAVWKDVVMKSATSSISHVDEKQLLELMIPPEINVDRLITQLSQLSIVIQAECGDNKPTDANEVAKALGTMNR